MLEAIDKQKFGNPMNHRHRKVLHAIFAHPISGNISFRDVEQVLQELGAEVSNKSGARIGVSLNGHTVAFHHGGHSLLKEDVIQVRKFLTDAGISADDYPV